MKEDEEFLKGSYFVSKNKTSITKIFVGKRANTSHKDFVQKVDWFDDINDVAYDEFGEHTEDYLMQVKKDKKEELNNLISEWLDKNFNQPTFFKIDEVNEISKEEFFEKYYNKRKG